MEKLKKILDSETNKWIVKKAKPQVFGIITVSYTHLTLPTIA